MGNDSLLRTDKELAEVYQRNVSSIYKLSYIYLKNTADAEDAVQSVFLKLLQKNMYFNDQTHERAWLITVTKNYCKNILRSWRKHKWIGLEALPEIASPEGKADKTEIIAKLLALPKKYRVVLYLYYLEGYSVKEIASLIERKESTIQSQLQRGREKLKNDLGGKIYGENGCEWNI